MTGMKSANRKIVEEAMIPAPVEMVWQRTQEPDLHVLWDIRFNPIRYLDEKDKRGFRLMDYRTSIGLGIEVAGFGHYLQSIPLSLSSFEFDSYDWKSIITMGRGIWLYKPRENATYFKTVYDYQVRFGVLGRLVDYLLFRNFIRLATEWGFETLRLWCMGNESGLPQRRSRLRFRLFYRKGICGVKPEKDSVRSWLGTGNTAESSFPEAQGAVAPAGSARTR
jgi:hypothetical protein